jgi:chitin synthase
MAEFILQRRRWLNGSFFAAVYAITHFYQIFRSDHTFIRKFMLMIEFVYQTIAMIFAWFGIVRLSPIHRSVLSMLTPRAG